jgi:hypothetical protein
VTGDATRETLVLTLQVAVPLRIAELTRLPAWQRDETMEHWAADAAEVLASNGDTLMFRTKPWKIKEAQLGAGSRRKPGDEVSTAATFNHLAKGLAAFALCLGGVTFGGVHWCVGHAWGVAPQEVSDLTCDISPSDPRPVERTVSSVTTIDVADSLL